ncbi:hypothetical protein [Streptomyces scabiei]|uniref:Secreted protein/lipoprotein n=1 Tax=Streptomyces scabiei TaxID=1930 RepID=A0A100JTJ3_STRSC|nr:hypothetical protein [Streptomyces scabiei]GAQ65424.1 hypothetical protein SsS58_05833 [Streptomyces scabiei]
MKRRAHHSAVHFRKAAAASLTLCAALSLPACSSSDRKDEASKEAPTVIQSPTASASADPKETAKKEAIAAYGAYWQEMQKLYADQTGKSAHLDQYAASAALKNAEADAKRAHDRGRIYTGSVALTDQTVTKVNVSGKIPNATVSSCLDISRWRRVDAETKKPVSQPENRLTKYLIVSTVEKYPEGWRVTRDEPQGKSC